MAKVITLDGLKSVKLGRRYRKCRSTTVVYSPTLGEEIEICEGRVPKRTTRRRRKPTMKKGRKRITATSCKRTKRVKTKNGKTLCMCVEPQGQILPKTACKIKRRKKR